MKAGAVRAAVPAFGTKRKDAALALAQKGLYLIPVCWPDEGAMRLSLQA
jgi:hypothetical protein